jgi:hypothetical protein
LKFFPGSSYEYWTFVVNVYGYCIGPFIAPLIVSLILLFIQKWCFPVRVDFNDITGILTADKIPVLTADKIPVLTADKIPVLTADKIPINPKV